MKTEQKLKSIGFNKTIDKKLYFVGQEVIYLGFDAYISDISGGCVSIVYKNLYGICSVRINEKALTECLSYSLKK